MSEDGTQDTPALQSPLPPVAPPSFVPQAPITEPASGEQSARIPRQAPLLRTAQLPVTVLQPAVSPPNNAEPGYGEAPSSGALGKPERSRGAMAPGNDARPVAASQAATGMYANSVQPAVPENAPITTSMPMIPTHKPQDESDVRDAARDLERRLLGSERTLRRREVAAGVGVSLLSARKLWRALGLPRVGDDEVAYTQDDEDALETIIDQVRDHRLSEEAALSITRSLGQLTDRMVIWQIEALVEDLVQNQGMTDAEARRQVILLLDELVEPIEKVMVYAYRRNLAAAVQRQVVRAESGLRASNEGRDGSEDDAALPLARAVGFADMVSFTKLSRRMDERTLAKLVQGFEARCSEIITVGGGRLVKTIGDEVLYVAETPQAGARIALTLAGEFADDPTMPKVRVGLVWGRVLSRLGDIYGATVNMAARLTAIAEPRQVLTDHLTAQVLGGDERFVITEQKPVHLHGFGDVTPYELAAGDGAGLVLD